MGAKGTVDISKNEALSFVLGNIHCLPNDCLADIVEIVNDHFFETGHDKSLGLANFHVMDNLDENFNDDYRIHRRLGVEPWSDDEDFK